jgi:hypothetical protein
MEFHIIIFQTTKDRLEKLRSTRIPLPIIDNKREVMFPNQRHANANAMPFPSIPIDPNHKLSCELLGEIQISRYSHSLCFTISCFLLFVFSACTIFVLAFFLPSLLRTDYSLPDSTFPAQWPTSPQPITKNPLNSPRRKKSQT